MGLFEDIDFDLVIESVSADVCNAQDSWYLPKIKQRYSVAFLPKIHHLYSGVLKSAWYKRLKQKNRLFVISEWKAGISVFNSDILFMWQKWNFDDSIFDKLDDGIKINKLSEWFQWIESELPYIRMLSEYDEIYFIEIWSRVKKDNVLKFLSDLYSLWNIVLLSDLYSDLPYSKSITLDEKTLNWKNKMTVFERFFSLAEKSKKKPRFIWYMNSSELDWNTKSTTWFCTMVF